MCYVMIYNRVMIFRAEAGMSRQELADKLGVNYQTIGYIERGDYYPSLELAFKIAAVFDIGLESIFFDRKLPPQGH